MRDLRSLILVVEDEPNLRSLLVECLSADFSVVSAATAAAGIDAAKELKPDLILCDYNMPGGNGLNLVGALHSDPRYSGIPVILMSGQRLPDEAVDLNLPFLAKPFDLHRLLEMTHSVQDC